MPHCCIHTSGVLALLTLALSGACDHVDADPSGAANEEFRPASDWNCRTCDMSNSPAHGTYAVDEFEAGKSPSFGSTTITGIRDTTGVVHPVVFAEGRVFADLNGSGVLAEGPALVDWTLLFHVGFTSLEVDIFGYEEHPDWVGQADVPTYSLTYFDFSSGEPERVSICPADHPDQTSIVFISDERYDTANNLVIPDQFGWVTAACRGHALAKMKMLGYDPHDSYHSDPMQRQATLRMLKADYCGNGDSWTVLGQPLEWRDAMGHVPWDGDEKPAAMEALFDEHGAICLDTPRVHPISAIGPCTIPACNNVLDIGDATWLTLVK
ncbi:MAG: hypothetical protein K0V04_28910 [Deltaproteobacteria bacterium]|nr:hypothetical protein [Deltaproteobacteria bacterium]